MLFDWRKQTEPVSLAAIISWLETKNPDEEYRFMDCNGGCLFSQYLQDRFHLPKMHATDLKELYSTWEELHAKYWSIASGRIKKPGGGFLHISTFGDALKRAREFVEG